MSNETMLPQLKAGSLVTIQLGSAFIGKIQECFQLHVTGHEEDMQKLKEKNGDYSQALTQWESQTLMYSTLLQEIMKIAEKDGQIEYISLDSMLESISPTENGQVAS